MSVSTTQVQDYVRFGLLTGGRTNGQVSPGGQQDFGKFLPDEEALPIDASRSIVSGTAQSVGVMTSPGGGGSQGVISPGGTVVTESKGAGGGAVDYGRGTVGQGVLPSDGGTIDYGRGTVGQGVLPSDGGTIDYGVGGGQQGRMPVDVWTIGGGAEEKTPSEVKWPISSGGGSGSGDSGTIITSSGTIRPGGPADPVNGGSSQLSSESNRPRLLGALDRYNASALRIMANSEILEKLT
ncbi:MAG: hypothetical protein IT538_05235 [Variibacter sp.]|nr:hypothetical protein [Variibacter sp.]